MAQSLARIMYFSFFGVAAIFLLGGTFSPTTKNSFIESIACILFGLLFYAIGWVAKYLITGDKSTIFLKLIKTFPRTIKGLPWFFREVAPQSLIVIFCFVLFAFLGSTILIAAGVITDQLSESPIILSTVLVSISLFFFVVGWSIRHMIVATGSIKLKLNTIKWTIVRWWGMLFRTIFISFIGIAGYFWFDPQAIGDIPFSALTLNQVFDNLFAVLITFGCIFWFFKFPDEEKTIVENQNSNPYYLWGAFSAFVVLISSVIAVIYAVWLM